ncbi:hypothetical protein HK102_008808 [Quaeritorhiza haematococci]|nr:hypothetical protein HK102_008808 [Quaeritorhiza haematococci]
MATADTANPAKPTGPATDGVDEISTTQVNGDGHIEPAPSQPPSETPAQSTKTEAENDDNEDAASTTSSGAAAGSSDNEDDSDAMTVSYKPPVARPLTKSEKIGALQSIFTEKQKIAYVGLCYLSVVAYEKSRLKGFKKAKKSFEQWCDQFMTKLYIYLDLSEDEQRMIRQLAEHGLVPSDLSTSLIDDAKKAAANLQRLQDEQQKREQEALDQNLPMPDPIFDDQPGNVGGSTTSLNGETTSDAPADVRYTILSHLFILCIGDGNYDARERALMRSVAEQLQVPWFDVIQLENTIAEQLRVHEDADELRKDDKTIGKRNTMDARGRWLTIGLTTLAGGAVIGLTAGLAAPLIGAGVGLALTNLGVAGAAGIMGTTTSLALITTGGVLTGGGMSGYKMMKRTRGISEFEFMSFAVAAEQYLSNREKRRHERRRKFRREAKEAKEKAQQEKLEQEAKAKQEAGKNNGTQTAGNGEAGSSSSSSLDSLPVDPSDPAGVLPPADDSLDIVIPSKSKDSLNADDPTETATVLWETQTNWDTETQANDFETNYDASTVMDDDAGIRFKEPQDSKAKQTNVLITVSGWLTYGVDDYHLPFSTVEQGIHGDQYTLLWESKALQDLGSTLKILVGEVAGFLFQQGLQATLLPILMAGLTGPLWALKLTYLLDNPWGNGLSKAKRAGRVLADTLIAQVQENRPVTLIGFSLGARAIFHCLLELANRGAYGLVEEAYIFGCPVMATKKEWEQIASVVAGRVVNGYLENDWVLGVLYRASAALWKDVAGLNPVQGVAGVENVKLDDVIDGHLEYRLGMPKILKKCGFKVTREYFDDEDEEEEHERLEWEEEKRKEKEEKMRAKAERLKQKQEEYERRKKEQEEARKAKEAARKSTSGKRVSWFGRVTTASSSKSTPPSNGNGTIKEDMTDEEVKKMLEMFQPREIESTLPALVIPKELKSTLPPLVISTDEKNAASSAPSETSTPAAKEEDAAAVAVAAIKAAVESGQVPVLPTMGAGDLADNDSRSSEDDLDGGR